MPALGDGDLLDEFPAEAVDALVDVAGPARAVRSCRCSFATSAARWRVRPPNGGATAALDAEFAIYSVGIAGGPGRRRRHGART